MINFRYNIKRKLGSGRSTVFLCEDTDFPGGQLAIKILPANVSAEEEKFLRDEYFTLRRLNHPNIIKANEIGTVARVESKDTDNELVTPGSRFIIMEYFEGSDLLKYNIKNEDILTGIIKQLCSVLYYLHQSNYIYYDLKPENILINEVNDLPVLKLIDLGLARLSYEENPENARGTSEYIAPELLNTTSHDHRVDFYSLGMLLYRLIYKKFPFTGQSELDIYKSHIAGEFKFPESSFSEKLVAVVKRLLAKDPSERYYTSLQILNDLDIEYHDLKKDWLPAKSFTDRKDVLTIIDSFINRSLDGELVTLRGTEGAGKSSVLEKIFRRYPGAVYIRNSGYSHNTHFWKILFREIVFSKFIYSNLTDDLINEAINLLEHEPEDLASSLKSVIFKIAKENRFILLLDEFNRFDELSLDIIKALIPVFQVNNVKIILTEDSSFPYLANSINNLTVLNLSPFTESHLIEYIDKSFAEFFPKKEIMKLVMMHADLLPGSIDSFLKDVILFGMLDFTPDGPVFLEDAEKIKLITESHDSLYNLQLELLSKQELKVVQCLSLFETVISEETLSACLNSDAEIVSGIVKLLREKNIISPSSISIYPEFRSSGLKNFIYSKIRKKKDNHKVAAEAIALKMPGFNSIELSRQFELAGLFQPSYEILKSELESAEKLSAYSYMKKVLLHLLEFPLTNEQIIDIKYALVRTLFRLSEKKYASEIIDDMLKEPVQEQMQTELRVLKGNCLISTGEPGPGVEILKEAITEIQTEQKRYEVIFDIASAQFDLNNYQLATELCTQIIKSTEAGAENKGKAYNLLALLEIQVKNNIDEAINYFKEALNAYSSEGLKLNVAGLELNLGNIYCLKAQYTEAEDHWDRALQINRSIGNLEQESKLLMSYGAYYYYKSDFESAIENFKQANSIFSTLGDKNSEALILLNLGETSLNICDFQNSYDYICRARKLFLDLKNYEQDADVLMMLGKYYFILGNKELLTEVSQRLRKYIENGTLTDQNKKHLSLLDCLILFNEKKFQEIADILTDLRSYYSETDNSNFFVFVNSLLYEVYLNSDKITECLNLLQSEEMQELCSRNQLLNAEKNYYLGRISELSQEKTLKPAIEYYREALDILEQQSVTELTWKVLYAVALFYLNRGMNNKAEEYFVYLRSIFEAVAENIKDNYTRQIYLNKPERKIIIGQLK